MEQTNCPNCSNRLYHNKGISKKNNKPYENYKCGSCDYIQWVDQIKPTDEKPEEKPTDLQMIFDQLQTLDKGLREIWGLLGVIQTKLDDIERK